MTKPIEIPNTAPTADALRRLALNEQAKAYVMADPKLAEIARKIAKKYVAGETRAEAIAAGKAVNERGSTEPPIFTRCAVASLVLAHS